MAVYKCILPLRHGGALNSRRALSPLVWLVEGEERFFVLTEIPLFTRNTLYEMTSLLRTSASPPMSPHQTSCSNHTAKESTAPREPQRTLKTLLFHPRQQTNS
ncbi:hypothetical protein TNCV_284831 [Trichonephila clavipes]|uniref:Uncharacterized protein n=1 Tax=Trichonephila clavipes TaxID=2585209 RepID=A0A8X6VMT1_TRICX|nr:hypothetical protein TNCV_284831 [Trichonephila clavipes]